MYTSLGLLHYYYTPAHYVQMGCPSLNLEELDPLAILEHFALAVRLQHSQAPQHDCLIEAVEVLLRRVLATDQLEDRAHGVVKAVVGDVPVDHVAQLFQRVPVDLPLQSSLVQCQGIARPLEFGQDQGLSIDWQLPTDCAIREEFSVIAQVQRATLGVLLVVQDEFLPGPQLLLLSLRVGLDSARIRIRECKSIAMDILDSREEWRERIFPGKLKGGRHYYNRHEFKFKNVRCKQMYFSVNSNNLQCTPIARDLKQTVNPRHKNPT